MIFTLEDAHYSCSLFFLSLPLKAQDPPNSSPFYSPSLTTMSPQNMIWLLCISPHCPCLPHQVDIMSTLWMSEWGSARKRVLLRDKSSVNSGHSLRVGPLPCDTTPTYFKRKFWYCVSCPCRAQGCGGALWAECKWGPGCCTDWAKVCC